MSVARPYSPFPILAAVAVSMCLAAPAPAKFVSPPDVVKDPLLTSLLTKLKKAKTPAESKPFFDAVVKLTKEDATPERLFTRAYLYQYGIGTEPSVEKAIEDYQKAADGGYTGAKNNLGMLMVSGGDAAKGVGIVEGIANAGDSAGQCTMGQLYLDGVPAAGIARDVSKARMWFERSAARGDADAAWSMAALLVNKPDATAAEVKQALPWLDQAVKANNLPALLNYGMRLATGTGLDPDPLRGIAMLQSAAAKGSTQARMALGGIYEMGGGVKKDYKRAMELYTEAAESGEHSAYNKLGYLHENGLGVPRDEARAAVFYKKGADQNVGVCLYNLAVYNEDGRGGLKKDPVAGFRLHYKGAVQGFVPCQLALGTRYREGKGTEKDPQAALAWYRRAMSNGDLTGALNVAAIMENGTSGIVDNKTAAEIYLKGAGEGNAQALASLGAMIEDGRGVQGSYQQVFLFYSAGVTAAVPGAKERLEKFKGRLTPDQLREAEEFAGEHRDKPQAVLPVTTGKGTALAEPPVPPAAAKPVPPATAKPVPPSPPKKGQ